MSTFQAQTTPETEELPKLKLYAFLFGLAAAATLISTAVYIATTMLHWPNTHLIFALAATLLLWAIAFECRRNAARRGRPSYPDAEAAAVERLFSDLDRKLRD